MIRGTSAAVPRLLALVTLTTLLLLIASSPPPATAQDASDSSPTEYEFEVLRVLDHDESAFTQGLLIHQGRMFESTGQYGYSTIREVNMSSGQVLRSSALDESEFGEGLAVEGNTLVQLTWKSGIAHVYDIESFEEISNFTYGGQGWGLCSTPDDPGLLFMSNGTSTITVRNSSTFEVQREITVTLEGESLGLLNELECHAGLIYANVWYDDSVYAIDSDTGEVVRVVDCSSLIPEGASETQVLNGIAFDGASGTWYLTGKLWPHMYEGSLVEVVQNTEPLEQPGGVQDTTFRWQISLIAVIAAALTYVLWGNGFSSLTKSRGVDNPPAGTGTLEGEE